MKNKYLNFKSCFCAISMAIVLISGGGSILAQNTSYNLNSVPISGSGNVGIGQSVLQSASGGLNVGVGYQALLYNFGGQLNTGVGYWALRDVTNGGQNTAVGAMALSMGSDFYYCSAVGMYALMNNTGNYNTAMGVSSLGLNSSGENNTAIGVYALNGNEEGYLNTAVGARALQNSEAFYNVAVGSWAMYANNSGSMNTAIGNDALGSNTSGGANSAVGHRALYTNTIGTQNSGLGYYANVLYHDLNNATAVGFNSLVTASNKVRLGSSTVTKVEGPVAYTVSDGRFKTNVREDEVKGLDFIQRLRPVVYNFETRAFTEFLTQNMPDSLRQHYLSEDFAPSTAIRQSGFIAQEVEAAAKAADYDFNGVAAPAHDGDNYSLAYGQFVVPLVKAVQEQQAMIVQQQDEIAALRSEVRALQAAQGSQPDANAAMRVFPNPSQGSFTIDVKSAEATSYEVHDIAGRLVARGTLSATARTQQLNLANEAKGTYVLRVFNGERLLATEKLILE